MYGVRVSVRVSVFAFHFHLFYLKSEISVIDHLTSTSSAAPKKHDIVKHHAEAKRSSNYFSEAELNLIQQCYKYLLSACNS